MKKANRRKKYSGAVVILCSVLLALGAAVAIVLAHPAFGSLPKGERLLRVKQSPNYRGGMFRNLEPTPQLVVKGNRFSRMRKLLGTKEPNLRPRESIPVVKTDLAALPPSEDLYIWLGHSSIFLQLAGGKKIMVDPVFNPGFPSNLVLKSFPHTYQYKVEDIPPLDLLLITHDHWDHLDYRTMRALKNRVKRVVCPLGVAPHLERWGYSQERITELDWFDSISLTDSVKLLCAPARHFSGRFLKRNQSLWAGYVLATPQRVIYIAGDGGYGTHIQRIKERVGEIDFAILENGQYNQNWRYIHNVPAKLVTTVQELAPSGFVTVHNAKFALARHPWYEPLDSIARNAKADSLPLLTPRIGEVLRLDSLSRTENWWASIREN